MSLLATANAYTVRNAITTALEWLKLLCSSPLWFSSVSLRKWAACQVATLPSLVLAQPLTLALVASITAGLATKPRAEVAPAKMPSS